MGTKNNEYKSNQIDRLRKWCIIVTDFIASLLEDKSLIKNQYDIIDTLYQKRDKKGFETVFNDLNEWALSLSQDNIGNLNLILINSFGKGLHEVNNKSMRKIDSIIKKGLVKNENEFRIIENRVNELSQMNSSSEEINYLNNLLLKYRSLVV